METINLILLLGVGFIASIIGSMIGTAMLILPPTMIFLGIPVHTAVATARFSMLGVGIGNITRFSLKDRIQMKYVVPFALSGVVGAAIGAFYLTKINEEVLKVVIGVLMIVVSVVILFEDNKVIKKKKSQITFKNHILSILAGLLLGSYIGVVGGGAATLIIFLLILIYGLSFQKALANQKAVTLPISIIATIIFIYQGLIDYKLGIPMLIVNLAGGWVGAGLILKMNNLWLKWLLVPVIIAMAIKLIFF